jgi:hypothetical protein
MSDLASYNPHGLESRALAVLPLFAECRSLAKTTVFHELIRIHYFHFRSADSQAFDYSQINFSTRLPPNVLSRLEFPSQPPLYQSITDGVDLRYTSLI